MINIYIAKILGFYKTKKFNNKIIWIYNAFNNYDKLIQSFKRKF